MKTMMQWVADVTTAKTRITIPILTNPSIELCGYTINEGLMEEYMPQPSSG